MFEVLNYFSQSQKGIKTDFYAVSMLQQLKNIMDFKFANNTLDLNSYLSILAMDLKTCNEFDCLKTFEPKYALFLERHLKQNNLNL